MDTQPKNFFFYLNAYTFSLSFLAIGKNVKLGEAQKKRLSDVKFIREMWEAKGQPNHQMFSRSLEKPDHEALHTVVGKYG